MKKNVNAAVFSAIPIIIASLFSCWSPFQPVTHIGQDVVTALDSNATDLKRGFKVINAVNLPVMGARSVVSPGNDTTRYRLKSGDFPGLFQAGRSGDDSVTAYAEFMMSSSDLSTYKTRCDSDSVNLVLYYDTAYNDKTQPTTTIQVFLCGRKFFPYGRNELGPVDDDTPCATIKVSRTKPDSFFINLGKKMVSKLNAAVADSVTYKPYPEKIDTTYGNLKPVVNPVSGKTDSVFGPDTVFRKVPLFRTDTLFNLRVNGIRSLHPVFNGDTTIVTFNALQFHADTMHVADTLKFHADSIIKMMSVYPADSTIISYAVLHFDSTAAHNDTSYIADTLLKFHADSIINLKQEYLGDATTIVSFSALQDSVHNDTVPVADTLTQFRADIITGVLPVIQGDTTILKFSAVWHDPVSAKFDTSSFIYDTSKKFIGAISMRATGGGIIRFTQQPVFQVVSRTACTDTVYNRNRYFSTYEDALITEINSIPSDSLVTSWQADRYIEMPISLSPLWDSVMTTGGQNFKIVQAASCSLYTLNSLFEGAWHFDTTRTIVFGLLDHTITDAKFHSMGTRDSLNALMAAGRFAVDTIHASPAGHQLQMTVFLQSLANENPRPSMAYLYIFERSAVDFGRVVFRNTPTIKFSALFSNPHQ